MDSLTLPKLKTEAKVFARELAGKPLRELYGITDGKAVGTFVEAAYNVYLAKKYKYRTGNAANGIDFPELMVDLKVTSIKQPQSSSPFRAASQKVYGLGYHLLVFVYDKHDDKKSETATLDFKYVAFVTQDRTADFQTTSGLLGILARNGNKDDIVAFIEERNLPLDEIGRDTLAEQILKQPPKQGYLTISNALQWRLQYSRVVGLMASGGQEGIENLLA